MCACSERALAALGRCVLVHPSGMDSGAAVHHRAPRATPSCSLSPTAVLYERGQALARHLFVVFAFVAPVPHIVHGPSPAPCMNLSPAWSHGRPHADIIPSVSGTALGSTARLRRVCTGRSHHARASPPPGLGCARGAMLLQLGSMTPQDYSTIAYSESQTLWPPAPSPRTQSTSTRRVSPPGLPQRCAQSLCAHAAAYPRRSSHLPELWRSRVTLCCTATFPSPAHAEADCAWDAMRDGRVKVKDGRPPPDGRRSSSQVPVFARLHAPIARCIVTLLRATLVHHPALLLVPGIITALAVAGRRKFQHASSLPQAGIRCSWTHSY